MTERRILVTGAAGFIGRQLIPELIRNGAEVLGVDRFPNPFAGAGVHVASNKYQHLQDEISALKKEIKTFLTPLPSGANTVFHLAGLADANYCYEHPDLAYEANVDLTFHLLEIYQSLRSATLVFPSTGQVYGSSLNQPATESDPVVPESVYAATKLAAESLIEGYMARFDSHAIIARLSNVYGPGMHTNTVIGKIVDQVKKGKEIRVRDERPVRDFIFIEDAIEALIRLSNIIPQSKTLKVNVSTGQGSSIGEVVDNLKEIIGSGEKSHTPCLRQTTSKLVLANNKLKALINWYPSIGISEGLKKCLFQKVEKR